MNERYAHLLALDMVEVCDANGKVRPLGLLALVAGGMVFLILFWIWVFIKQVTGKYV